MRILMTGGTGFIGRELAQNLEGEITVLTRNPNPLPGQINTLEHEDPLTLSLIWLVLPSTKNGGMRRLSKRSAIAAFPPPKHF